MSAQNGKSLLLKISNGESPEQFITLGGLRMTRMAINRQPVASTAVTTGKWREALSAGGIATMQMQGNGVFLNREGEARMQEAALDGARHGYRLYFGNGDWLEAECIITRYERMGNIGEVQGFSVVLESASAVIYHAAE